MSSEKTHPALLKVSQIFLRHSPFFAEIFLSLNLCEISEDRAREMRRDMGYDPDQPMVTPSDGSPPFHFPTASVQLEPCLQMNWYRPFLDSLSLREVLGLVIHEVMHIVSLTVERFYRGNYPGNLTYLWNLASDFVINQAILERIRIPGIDHELPPTNVVPKTLQEMGYQGPLDHEHLMSWLIRQGISQPGEDRSGAEILVFPLEFPLEGDLSPARAPSASGPALPVGEGGFRTLDQHDGLEKPVGGHTLARIRDLVSSAQHRGWGDLSQEFRSWIEKTLRPPAVNWKQVLRKYLTREMARLGTVGQRTWSRPSRREGIPMKRRSTQRFIFAVDTSGSFYLMDNFDACVTEVENLLRTDSEITLLQWDVHIRNVWPKYRKGDYRKLEVLGGGGTSVQCVFDWLRDNRRLNDYLIVFTDGNFSYAYDTHGARHILWLVFRNTQPDPSNGGRHGRTIHIV